MEPLHIRVEAQHVTVANESFSSETVGVGKDGQISFIFKMSCGVSKWEVTRSMKDIANFKDQIGQDHPYFQSSCSANTLERAEFYFEQLVNFLGENVWEDPAVLRFLNDNTSACESVRLEYLCDKVKGIQVLIDVQEKSLHEHEDLYLQVSGLVKTLQESLLEANSSSKRCSPLTASASGPGLATAAGTFGRSLCSGGTFQVQSSTGNFEIVRVPEGEHVDHVLGIKALVAATDYGIRPCKNADVAVARADVHFIEDELELMGLIATSDENTDDCSDDNEEEVEASAPDGAYASGLAPPPPPPPPVPAAPATTGEKTSDKFYAVFSTSDHNKACRALDGHGITREDMDHQNSGMLR